jgi:hypothetical protein
MEKKSFNDNRQKNHCRYYQIAGVTIRVESGLPLNDVTFHPKFRHFEVDGPGEDNITIRHIFGRLPLKKHALGKTIYSKPPWDIYRRNGSWIYMSRAYRLWFKYIHQVAVINHDHTSAKICNRRSEVFRKGNLYSLSLFPTDQIILARVLADREGCYLHAGGVVLDCNGFLFVGHSEAGKSTMVTMLKHKAEILCDDRIILRRWPDGFKIHGTWSHGDVPQISNGSAPLRAILFLEQAQENRLTPLDNKKEIIHKLLTFLIKPFVTADWWVKMLMLVEHAAHEVPHYNLKFDKSGKVVDLLDHL